MNNYVPIEKMSKKARLELMKARRGTWGALNPVTRRPEDPKKYNRKKNRRVDDSYEGGSFFCFNRLGRPPPMRRGTPAGTRSAPPCGAGWPGMPLRIAARPGSSGRPGRGRRRSPGTSA